MKRLTTLLIIAALVFQGVASLAQIDDAKMERDLRVASGVLASLMNNDSDHMFRGGEPEANYVEGFGVIFTIEDNMIFRYNYKFEYEIAKNAEREARNAIREAQRDLREAEKDAREVEREKREKDKNKDKDKDKNYIFIAPIPAIPPVPRIDISFYVDDEKIQYLKKQAEEANDEFSENLRKAFETFLVDYSQLISQLKPTDKILISTKSNSSYSFMFSLGGSRQSENQEKSRLSAEMLIKDHNDFQDRKLSREKLIAKIKFVENAEIERRPDLDLYGNMLKTTYNSKYTETYFISSIPKYEFLAGLGVVYLVKVYSSYSEDGLYRMPGNKKSGLSGEERNKAVELMYPQFVESFKENMIRYGSTIKSLDNNEKLIVKVKMTKCETCSFPSMIEFMVDKSVLDQFSKGSLTLDQAKNKVKLN